METIKNTILTGWNLMRWLRLAIGLAIAYQAFTTQNGLLGLLAGIFIFQALANAACCGTSACNTSMGKKTLGTTEDVEFEEIKSK
ncbi:MAG: hypothetical protein WBJ10_16695 [Daejeonella sp.]|uniref:hypothetical protein n=1 Tax=Daejeonella sp. TaxID=2805397 RepID=UPI003C716CBA